MKPCNHILGSHKFTGELYRSKDVEQFKEFLDDLQKGSARTHKFCTVCGYRNDWDNMMNSFNEVPEEEEVEEANDKSS